MDSLSDLDKAREELDKLDEFYKRFEKLELPTSLRKAVDEQWEFKQDIIQLGMKESYNAEEKKADKMHVVKCRHVLQAILDLESGIVEKAVVNPVDGVWRKVRFLETIGGILLDHGQLILKTLWFVVKQLLATIWDAIKAMFFDPIGAAANVIHAFESAWAVIVGVAVVMTISVLKYLLKSFGAVQFQRTVKACFKERDSAIAFLHRRTLTQGSGTRYFRRKETVT